MPAVDPAVQGREDCDDAVASGADPAALAAAETVGPDGEMMVDFADTWVLDAAGVDINAEIDFDAEWTRVGIPWCMAYMAAFRTRAAQIAAAR